MKQKLLLILMLVSFYSSVFAQSTRASQEETITVTEMNSLLSSGNTSGSARMTSASTGAVNVRRLKDLVTQVQSSTYFYEGVEKTYGEMPTNLFTDLSSLRQVSNSITAKQNIEIVTITINTSNELNSTIDLAAFSNFPNLKYIYFITKLNTTSANIASHINNYDARFSIFYKIDKGDSNQ